MELHRLYLITAYIIVDIIGVSEAKPFSSGWCETGSFQFWYVVPGPCNYGVYVRHIAQ